MYERINQVVGNILTTLVDAGIVKSSQQNATVLAFMRIHMLEAMKSQRLDFYDQQNQKPAGIHE